jgi:hypothetical protein
MIATRKKKSKPSKGQSLQGIGRGIGPRNNQQALSSQLSRENNKRKKKKKVKSKKKCSLNAPIVYLVYRKETQSRLGSEQIVKVRGYI